MYISIFSRVRGLPVPQDVEDRSGKEATTVSVDPYNQELGRIRQREVNLCYGFWLNLVGF